MNYYTSKPSPVLSKLVKHYWTMESCLPDGVQHVQRIVPAGLVDLTFYFENIPESLDKEISLSERTVVTGQLNKYFDLVIKKKLSLFSIIFQPQGLAALLEIPVSELFNQAVPFKYLMKESFLKLEDQLFRANSFNERINITERFLMHRLQKVSQKYHMPRIEHSISLINQNKGLVSVDYLAREACFGRKQFERIFTGHVGSTPKKFMNIVRFQHAIHERAMHKDENLTSLTYKCGYYDQSHMTSDFLKLSGMTPGQYFRECEPFSDYFQ